MQTLSRYIETMLIKHDCVVVPGLGGFVTQYQSAYYDGESGCYVPPTRSVSFNSMLAINDGLLVERYQSRYNLSYTAASRLLSEKVEELKSQVYEKGEVELIGIGTLISNGERKMNFIPRSGGLATPSLYALENTFIPLYEKTVGHTDSQNTDRKNYIIRLNKETVNYLVAAVFAIMFYFVVAPTGINDSFESRASIVPSSETRNTLVQKHIVVMRHKSTPVIEIEKDTTTTLTIQETAEASTIHAVETKGAAEDTNTPTPKYVVVLASSVSLIHANDFVATLQNQGYKDARVFTKGEMRRVVVGSFSTYDDAKLVQRTISANKQYADCWILHIEE